MFEEFPTVPKADDSLPGNLELGAFSISLPVADLARSREFYEGLGFVVTGGDPAANYLILKNGETTIGLFHGMFDRPMLTFNPGMTNRMELLESYTDVREIQQEAQDAGLTLDETVVEVTGPGHVTLTDPDGNPILIDQFF